MVDLKQAYKTVMEDHFTDTITISFGDQKLVYQKRAWKIPDSASGELVEKGLRYGENPGQEAALYMLVNGNLVLGECRFIDPGKGLVSAISEADMLQAGKHPGKTNLTDIDNGLNVMKYLMSKPTAVILKHNNPCGVASADVLAKAYARANRADRIAAFGGCVVFNRALDIETAELIRENYLEVVAAPDYEEGAVEILKKSKNLRIVQITRIDRLQEYSQMRFVDIKSLMDGGLIVQQSPLNRIRSREDFTIAETTYKDKTYGIDREPTEKEYSDMLFGWSVEQGVTSNSVLYVKDETTVGVGTGEQDRVGVAEIAIYKAYTKYKDTLCYDRFQIPYKTLEMEIADGKRPMGDKEAIDKETDVAKAGLIGATMVSDAFFPFRDGVDVAIKEGISAIVHPGGSLRDFASIQACNEASPKVTMVFTGQRAFKH
ncbi:MAG: IMP cyclohydrolase [Deltaproteobacteria bacterium]|nr:IMP cyclohydrolase [Deltaproteobacteria bacterium]